MNVIVRLTFVTNSSSAHRGKTNSGGLGSLVMLPAGVTTCTADSEMLVFKRRYSGHCDWIKR